MKKLISLLVVLTLVCMMSIGLSATTDDNRGVEITATIAPSYTVVIPKDTTVVYGQTTTAFGSVTLTAANLEPGG